jgi:hypothetical protein
VASRDVNYVTAQNADLVSIPATDAEWWVAREGIIGSTKPAVGLTYSS